MEPGTKRFLELIKHPLRSRIFLFSKLPSAYFAGVRVREADENRCIAIIPYKWFSQNPFGSTYFACLSMAAEMTTGLLGLAHIFQRQPSVSMLVTKVDSEYFKKATGITTFTCEDGMLFKSVIAEAIATGEARSVTARSTGLNEQGELVARFFVTWSLKVRKGVK